MHLPYTRLLLVVCVLVAWQCCCLVPGAYAEDVIFTIDPNQSTTTWSGTDNDYGAFGPVTPGSLSAPVSGHFLVRFDPLNGTPSTIQFVGGDGYFELASPYTVAPGVGGSETPAPANVAMTTAGGEATLVYRNLVWDFESSPVAGTGGVFPATETPFAVLSGEMDGKDPGGSGGQDLTYNGYVTSPTSGSWTLSETSPGSGDWTLATSGDYTYSYNGFVTNGVLTAALNSVATAHFGAANVASVSSTDTEAEALGGSGSTGGVSVNFAGPTTGGTFSVQQVPDNTGLSQAAVAAAAANPIFALSTSELSVAPQIWNVQYDGSLDGGTATLVFNYDPTLLPTGTDPTTLGIWHFSKITDEWVFGGIVDPLVHTITFETDSFSPFQLGINVPEPGTWALAMLGLGCLALPSVRRRVRRQRAG